MNNHIINQLEKNQMLNSFIEPDVIKHYKDIGASELFTESELGKTHKIVKKNSIAIKEDIHNHMRNQNKIMTIETLDPEAEYDNQKYVNHYVNLGDTIQANKNKKCTNPESE